MFRLFEKVLNPTYQPVRTEPPGGLMAFYWHFARQAKGLFVGLFVTGFLVALLDSMIPVFMGRVVSLITGSDPGRLWDESWRTLLGMAAVLLIMRPLALTSQNLITHQAIAANVANMIRWQAHWHVARPAPATRTPMCATPSTSTPGCSTPRCGSTRCSASA
jgi:ATP-binding cassette subfamily B multidrug efflux pump